MRTLALALTVTFALPACDDDDGAAADYSVMGQCLSCPDAEWLDGPPDVATPDAATRDAATPDAAPPDLGPDVPPRCPDPPPHQPTGPLPGQATPLAGIDAVERPSYEALRDAVLADPGVHFVATFDQDAQRYLVESAAGSVAFVRTDGRYEVVEGELATVFPSTDPLALAGYDAELAGFENPNDVQLEALGYAADDPRVGFVNDDTGSYPLPLVRIATLFDAIDAPDFAVDLRPWAAPSPGSHGMLSVLQSRAAFALSGAGARRGVLLDNAAAQVDIAPTVMAALGAPTTGGVGPDGTYDDGLYLLRQDGRVQWDALTCIPAERAVVVLFDGLLGSEIAHLALDDDAEVDLPTFREFFREGVVFSAGAVSGWPSVSAPGHMTAGTGVWQGHHGVLHNGFWGRADGARVSPFSILTDPQAALMDPQIIFDIYDRAVADDIETLSAAVERAFGADVFTVVLNELSFGGADLNSIDLITGGGGGQKIGVTESRAADLLGVGSVENVLRRVDLPVPKLLQLSLVITDSAGESDGPHSDLLRDVMVETDARLARVRQAYADRDALEGTLFVFVADHGMELQDPSRVVDPGPLVAASGVRTRLGAHPLVYLVTLDVTRDGNTAVVTDRDTGLPVAGVQLVCEGCEPVVTDDAGRAPADALSGTLDVTHPAYNPRTFVWSAD